MILQLDPPLPFITPKGRAYAHFLIDYGQEHDLLWVCFMCETGECWSYPNSQIRMEANMSLNYKMTNPDLLAALSGAKQSVVKQSQPANSQNSNNN